MQLSQLRSALLGIINNYKYGERTHYDWKLINTCYLVTAPRTALNFQRLLEKRRPQIEYILLPTGQFLITLSSEFESLKKTALTLAMQRIVDQQKVTIRLYEESLAAAQFVKYGQPIHELFPELCL